MRAIRRDISILKIALLVLKLAKSVYNLIMCQSNAAGSATKCWMDQINSYLWRFLKIVEELYFEIWEWREGPRRDAITYVKNLLRNMPMRLFFWLFKMNFSLESTRRKRKSWRGGGKQHLILVSNSSGAFPLLKTSPILILSLRLAHSFS